MKEVKREAKVGEYIKIVKANSDLEVYKNGDFLKVIAGHAARDGSVFVRTEEHDEYDDEHADRDIERPFSYVLGSEYVVLEGYIPDETKG